MKIIMRRISVIFLCENYRNGTATAVAYRAQPPEGRHLARSSAVRQYQPSVSKKPKNQAVIANQPAENCGMTATGSHNNPNSLRGAPLVWQSPRITRIPHLFARNCSKNRGILTSVVLRAGNLNLDNCQWQLFHNFVRTGSE